MKSLRELRKELTGIRMNATNVDQWNVVETVNEYARIAINDAITAFPVRVGMTYTSGVAANGVLILPYPVERVISVEDCGGDPARREIEHWKVFTTPSTVYLRVHGVFDGRLDVAYVYRQPPLPRDTVSNVDSSAAITVTGAKPSNTWPKPPAYIEMSLDTTDDGEREVAMYGEVTDTSFAQLSRAVEGVEQAWVAGTPISACYIAPDGDLRPTMLLAQAVMYEFFLRHRALYEQYTAMASMQALGLDDLQLLIRDLEARARLDYEARVRSAAPQFVGR